MASGKSQTYVLTVRPHRSEDGRYEFILSRPGSEPMVSDGSYSTYEAAKKAGDEIGQGMGLEAGPSSADE